MISTSIEHTSELYKSESGNFPNLPSSMRNGKLSKLLEFEISNLTAERLQIIQHKIIQLAEFARMSRIQIIFQGLNEFSKKYEQLYCCTWHSKEMNYPEKALLLVMLDIQTKSLPSPRKYEIKLKF